MNLSSIFRRSQTPPVPGQISTAEIWHLTFPLVVMTLFQFMVSFTDVWVAGRINAGTQSALGLVNQCFIFFLVVAIAIANASVAAMSQSLGARKPWRARRYFGMVIGLGLAFCLFTLATGFMFRRQLMLLLQVPDDIFELSVELWSYYLLALPGQYALTFSSAAFRAHKNMNVPMYTSIVVFVVNGVMDFGLGLGRFGMPNLGPVGLALATFISGLAGAAFNYYVLHRLGYLTRKAFAPLKWQKKALGYVLKVALPSGGLSFSWQAGYMVLMALTASVPKDSVASLAGLTTGMRIEGILFMPAIAFGFTGSVLVGHALGAGNKAAAKRVGMKILLTASGGMSLVALCLWPFVGMISSFMAPDPLVAAYAVSYIRYNLFSTPFTVSSMILSGILTGAGASLYPFIVYSISTWLVRLPIAWYLGHIAWQDASGIYFAMLISQIVQCSVAMYIFLKCDWTRFAMNKHKMA